MLPQRTPEPRQGRRDVTCKHIVAYFVNFCNHKFSRRREYRNYSRLRRTKKQRRDKFAGELDRQAGRQDARSRNHIRRGSGRAWRFPALCEYAAEWASKATGCKEAYRNGD
nr:MAG TPA: hypothetical protein [Caudoviricetes sp.]